MKNDLIWNALLALGLTALAAVPAWTDAGTFFDPLTGGINPTYFSVTQTTAGLYSDTSNSGGLQLAWTGNQNPGGTENVTINLNMGAVGGPVSGDFSTQVSFANAVLPGVGLDEVELHTLYSDGLLFDDRRLDWQSYGDVYDVYTGQAENDHSTTVTAGTFTISRSGNTVTGLFDGSSVFPKPKRRRLRP